MFRNPSFGDLTHSWTLRFKNNNLEADYKALKDEDYLHKFSPFYWIILSVAIITGTISYMTYVAFSEGLYDEAWGTLISALLLFGGIILELIVNFWKKLRIIRTAPLGLCVFFATAVGNCLVEETPVVRLGYSFQVENFNRSVGLLLLVTLDFIAYSYNWIVGAIIICSGVITWFGFFIATYITKVSCRFLGVGLANFFLGIWVLPLLLYWNERRTRQAAYWNWCKTKELNRWKRLLNRLPVGVLIYKRRNLRFASLAAKKLLLGSMESDLPDVDSAIHDSNQLKTAIDAPVVPPVSESTSLEQIHVSNIEYTTALGESKPLSVNSLVLGIKAEPYKVCILQDQSLYAELEKEKVAKEYTKKFFAMITHELRNPLQGVLGIFETLVENFPKQSYEAEQCRMGISTVKLMMQLVNDLLDLTQIETGNFSLVKDNANIKEMLCECAELMHYKFRSKGVELIPRIFGTIPIVRCDPNRYKQIVLNLLGNAIKFTEKGSVTLKAEYDYTSEKLVTTVEDTGIGVKPEDQGKLFTFFGKIEEQKAHNPQGVGLGLYICKKLVQAMGGEISLESEYLKGTTIRFTIQNTLEEPPNVISLSISREKVDSQSEAEEDVVESPVPPYRLPYPFMPTNALTLSSKQPVVTEPKMEVKPALVVDDEFICVSVLQAYLRGCGIDSDSVYSFPYNKCIGYIWSPGCRISEREGKGRRVQSDVCRPEYANNGWA
eukprot:TRINITY_DN2114_c0_g1_i1.p1 TRINITY_DN2114_c0_g1~~TRINITY_DN2114_c0_g1_i1.p1  ORF type:complete len:720 (+),score=53.20 TRINITY_DN2114_c0_g1_i1:154-2313(+)